MDIYNSNDGPDVFIYKPFPIKHQINSKKTTIEMKEILQDSNKYCPTYLKHSSTYVLFGQSFLWSWTNYSYK